jgi:hypothetical protein
MDALGLSKYAYVNGSNISAVIDGKPSAVVEKAEQNKLKQVRNEVANLGWHQRRWALQRRGRCAAATPL